MGSLIKGLTRSAVSGHSWSLTLLVLVSQVMMPPGGGWHGSKAFVALANHISGDRWLQFLVFSLPIDLIWNPYIDVGKRISQS